ncbi:NAD-dependent epimerase/dehydratase [Hydrogenophaga taeniospiralis CCUG 15921]|uniref:NAD-dependent epimerase/dehydratase n=1 Tax=Hydrogenophaga taeniospiralis CCUG 15921 TaxID=1281780 RepID=A0A9X4NQ23_9BURK|nr:SDR family oxidoreductase [Hydrogenophaga taeniospiralis]MDG5974486.1 NAD-dependent epimerase/dehydratase [Hydrogenophaga taeniospiralis CCUG 15921]
MKILVTGTDGYIGSLLGSVLLERGHDVVGIDTGFYRDGWLYNAIKKAPQWISKDIRNITEKDLEGFEAVVHLAELSNDPLGKLNNDITYEINHVGSVELAKKCKNVGVSRFVYTSSCSAYGIGGDDFKTEESATDPQTAYAKCKVKVERDVSPLASEHFSPTFLRNATAYGPSPRMRFDIVLNNLSGLAWTTKEIKMTSDGQPWRPLVHVLDICDAIGCVLDAPREKIHNQIFNVGSTSDNYRVKEIAEIVAETFTGCSLSFGTNDADNRSYRVSFDKISTQLGFKCKRNAKIGAEQLYEVFKRIDMPPEIFNFRAFTRLKQIEYLIRTQQIDDKFFWSV